MKLVYSVAPMPVRCALGCLLLLGLIVASPLGASADAPVVTESPTGTSFSVDWLEPQGLNIADLVGQVPEEQLRGSIISHTPGYGILRYISGEQKNGLTIITAAASTRFVVDRGWSGSMFSCLGQPARLDQLGSAAPPSTMKAFYQGKDVTHEVLFVSHVPIGKTKPIRNPRESEAQNQYRYWETAYASPTMTPDRQISLPANMGCEMIVSERNYPELTLVFTIYAPSPIRASFLGSQTFTFHSYLGPGYTGLIESLVTQLRQAGYGFRADKFSLSVPAGADYFYLNFPVTPVDPYTAFPENQFGNVDRPTGGTYRIGFPSGLSVDHVNSMALPLRGHWQDSDQAQGEWLPYANTYSVLAAPEYFLPAGVPYHPCMVGGGCSGDLLRAVYNTPMTMTISYLKIDRVSPYLERLPVQMVGTSNSCSAATAGEGAGAAAAEVANPGSRPQYSHKIYMARIPNQRIELPPDDANGCSPRGGCGWFTPDGRMVDYIPLP